jgi:hypothetical protein
MEIGSFKNGIRAWINRVVDERIESINWHCLKTQIDYLLIIFYSYYSTEEKRILLRQCRINLIIAQIYKRTNIMKLRR